MYMDSVVFFSIVTVLAIILMMVYVFRYMYKHIKADEQGHQQQIKLKESAATEEK
ncbi:hypothetical protein TDB9533_04124 [Thalassocella blandensis]|nr:hypothetical protein TDB9533_04124 [Thalassocella blandensis]